MEKPWLKHYDEGVSPHLDYPDFTLHRLLERSSSKFANQCAIHFYGSEFSYQQVWGFASTFASHLIRMGFKKGDRVVLFLPNCPQMVIALYGTLIAGGVAVPTNPLYQERELKHQIVDAGAEIVVTLDLLLEKVTRVKEDTKVHTIILTAIQDYLPPLKRIMYPLLNKGGERSEIKKDDGIQSFKKLMAQVNARETFPEVSSEDLAILQYTGGTTGLSKGAMLTHRNLVSNTYQMRSWYFAVREGKEIVLAVLPLFHSYGIAVCMNFSIITGSTILLIPRFSPPELLKAIQEHQVTLFPGIPGIYSALIHYRGLKKYNLSTIRFCISGAAPLPIKIMEEFEQLTGGLILEGYGLSEASPVTHSNPLYKQRKTGSIGLPLPDTDCRIVDLETGSRELPVGEEGELCIKGPQVMKGYWNRPEETANTIREGWLYTGDIARMDSDGYFYIVDRKKDMIICEGFNVYPKEIDDLLLRHPKILEAATVGIPDELRGERIHSYIVIKEYETATPDEILAYCRENLAKYKIPRRIFIRQSLPKNSLGKILKRELKKETPKGC
ncbi:MAG TPA: long-chain fatty acid--CoA ligase [Thermodesulfobacteriota bacterium]|nr:long-chain fatty acid--CoA ligase [Thermodesulfobacteriota bacterium]